MPIVVVNDVNINFEEFGSGEPVVLIMGSGARGRLWTAHQVPALTAAGYQVITVDNRGVPPSDTGPEGFTIDDMVADTVGLMEVLGIAPCRIVGFSLGGVIVAEMLLAHPGLVSQAVLMAARGRADALRSVMAAAESELLDSDIVLPPKYAAVVHALQYLSPSTLNDEQRIRDWLDIFELSAADSSVGRAQRGLDSFANRLENYRNIECPCLVVGFEDDVIAPPHLCREIAQAIPGSQYAEITGCGHYGYLEEPDKVNSCIIDFFRSVNI